MGTPANPVLAWLGQTTAHAGVLVGIILLVQWTAGRWLSPQWRYRLWGLLVLRLVLPALPPSPWSVFNVDVVTAVRSVTREPPAPVDARPSPVPSPAVPAGSESIGRPLVATAGTYPMQSTEPQPVVTHPPVAVDRGIRLGDILLAIWAAGAITLLTHLVLANWAFARRLRDAVPVTDAMILGLLDRCRREMGLRVAPALLETDAARGPAVTRVWRPRLLVPPGLLGRLSADEVRMVFLHELAHVRCRDVAANWLMAAVQVVHWFNPLVWLAFARCRADREIARDAMVLARLATGPSQPPASESYGHALLKLLEAVGRAPAARPATAAAGMFGVAGLVTAVGILPGRGRLHRRIRMIARFPRHADRHAAAAGVVGALLFAAVGCATLTGPKRATPPTAGPQAQKSEPRVRDVTNPSDEAAEAEARQALQAVLDRKLPEVHFDDVPFVDVVDFFRDVGGTSIFVNWKALEAGGIDRNATVTTRLRNVRFSKAITVVLDHVSTPKTRLGYQIDDGVITITTEEDLHKNVVTRVYDVRDLIIQIPQADDDALPDFNLKRASTNAPAARPATTAPDTRQAAPPLPETRYSREQAVEDLVRLIIETVDPRGWRETGGKIGSIKELSGQLVITQTPESHRLVGRLLDQLRESRGVQVLVESRFIAMDDETAEVVHRMVGATGPRAAPATGPASTAPASAPIPLGPAAIYFTDAQVDEVLRVTQASDNSTTLSAPRVIALNGQRAYVQIGQEIPLVTDYRKIDGAAGEPARYEPVTETVASGLLVDVTATASADRKYVTLTLRPQLSALLAVSEVPWPDRPPGSDLVVKVPVLRVNELRTTVSVPDGQTIVLTGLEEPSDPAAAPTGGDAKPPATGPATRPARAKPRKLLMLVKPTLIVRRADEPKSFPLLQTKPEAAR